MVISFLKIFLHVFTLALPGSIPDPSFKTQVVVPGRHINEPSWRFDSVSLQRGGADCPNCYIARESGQSVSPDASGCRQLPAGYK